MSEGYFTVEPKRDCPHVQGRVFPRISDEDANRLLVAPCSDCDSTSENWICHHCLTVGCSRYVNGHMQIHCAASNHVIVSSFSDLSTWCQRCESYIIGPEVQPMRVALYRAKFQRDPPNTSLASKNDEDTISFVPFNQPRSQQHQHQHQQQSNQSIEEPTHYPDPTPLPLPPTTDASSNSSTPLPQSSSISSQQKYGHTRVDDIQEFEDAPNVLRDKVRELAQFIRQSNYLVAFTGAGISTSADIPDYRGPNGVWTLRDRGEKIKSKKNLTDAIPTYSHMALVALQNANKLKHLVSTNVDGLHRRSGIRNENLSELHGNIYQESCFRCKQWFTREHNVRSVDLEDYDPRAALDEFVRRHGTGRLCDACGDGALCDTIIHFNEPMPIEITQQAFQHAMNGDLALVLGTSMRVRPACELPEPIFRQNGGRLVIVNLQRTPYDSYCALRVWARCDDVMRLLMAELECPVPSFDQQVWRNMVDDLNRVAAVNARSTNAPSTSTSTMLTQNREIAYEGYVEPQRDCPHVNRAVILECADRIQPVESARTLIAGACRECAIDCENWLCIECDSIFCGRAANRHMMAHYQNTDHSIVASLSDLSFWCYECDNYITSPALSRVFDLLHRAKHNQPAPSIHDQ